MLVLLLHLQAFATFAMTGIIWFVQIVHYPLFGLIPDPHHQTYAAQHQTRTGWVVAPLMLVELATSLLFLTAVCRPVFVSLASAVFGFALVAAIWISTAVMQIPMHNRLLSGMTTSTVHKLVTTNWIRTGAWSLRAALILTWLAQ